MINTLLKHIVSRVRNLIPSKVIGNFRRRAWEKMLCLRISQMRMVTRHGHIIRSRSRYPHVHHHHHHHHQQQQQQHKPPPMYTLWWK